MRCWNNIYANWEEDAIFYEDYDVTFSLTEEQNTQLRIEMEKFSETGNYSDAYKYLGSIVPKSDFGNHTPRYTSDESSESPRVFRRQFILSHVMT